MTTPKLSTSRIVRWTDDDYSAVKAFAESRGLTVSALVRTVTLDFVRRQEVARPNGAASAAALRALAGVR